MDIDLSFEELDIVLIEKVTEASIASDSESLNIETIVDLIILILVLIWAIFMAILGRRRPAVISPHI